MAFDQAGWYRPGRRPDIFTDLAMIFNVNTAKVNREGIMEPFPYAFSAYDMLIDYITNEF